MHPPPQVAELCEIFLRILLQSHRVLGVGFDESIRNVAHLLHAIGNRHPNMGIRIAVVMRNLFIMVVGIFPTHQQGNPLAGINHTQVRELVGDFFHKALHTSPIDDKNVRLFDIFHILGLQLVIMQTPRLLPGHIVHLDAINPICNI